MLRHAGKMDYSSVEETTLPYEQCFEETPVRIVKDLGRSPQSSRSQSRVGTKLTTGFATTGSGNSLKDFRDILEARLNAAVSALTLQHQQALMLVDELYEDYSPADSPDGKAALPGALSSDEEPDESKSLGLTEGRALCLAKDRSGKMLGTPKSNGAVHEVPTVNVVRGDEFLPNQVKDFEELKSQCTVSDHVAMYQSRTLGSQRTSATAQDRLELSGSPSSPKESYGKLLSPRNMRSPKEAKQRKHRRPEPVFADAVKMKEQVKLALRSEEYNVQEYYKTVGTCQAIARNNWFENVTLGVISFNSIWIAIDTDHNHAKSWADTHWVFIFVENFFCVYFAIEILIRFLAFNIKKNCLRDAWFVFDSALVIMMVSETWIMNFVLWLTGGEGSGGLENMSMFRMIRLLRMTRMLRMVRLMRAVPELMILLKGISAATRSVFFTLCLLALMIYIFAIAFTQMCEDTDFGNEYFPTVPIAMNNLLLKGTLPDLAQFVEDAGREGWFFQVLMLVFILLSSLTVLNMLVGVLVEVVSVVSAVEKEQMMVNFVKAELGEMLMNSEVDMNGNKHITKMEFQLLLQNPAAAKIIAEIGVDVVGLVDYADFIFRNADELSFPDFMELVMQLRGQNTPAVKDMVDLRQFVTKLITDSVKTFEKLALKSEDSTSSQLHRLEKRLGTRIDVVSTNLEKAEKRILGRPVAPAASNVPTPVGNLVAAAAPHSPAPVMPMIPVVDEGEEMEC